MKRKHWRYVCRSKGLHRILLVFLFLLSCSPAIVPYAHIIVQAVYRSIAETIILASTVVLHKITHRPSAYNSTDDLVEQYRRQQQQREQDIQHVVGTSGTFKEVVSNIQQEVKASPSLPVCVDSPSQQAQVGWKLVFKQTPIFADALQRELTHPMQQSLFTAARHAVISDSSYKTSPLGQLIAREQAYEQRLYEIANEQECEHQLKLAEDAEYANKYTVKREIAQILIEQLVSGSEADRLSMTNQLFYRYKNDLAGHDRFAVYDALIELKNVYIGQNELPRENISTESKEFARKKFEQFKLRLERSPKEYIYICPAQFHVSPDDVTTAGFVFAFIEFCEKRRPKDAFDWLTDVTMKDDKKLMPHEREQKRCIQQHQSLFNTIYNVYKAEWEKVYTSDGLVKLGKNDPCLTQLTKSQRAKISSNAQERAKFNTLLHVRHHRLKQLKSELRITGLKNKKKAAECNKILHSIIDREMVNATTLQHIDYIVDQMTPETLPVFFNKNGLCKLHANNPAVSGASVLYTIDTPLHRDLLKRLNYLAALDASKLHQPSINRLQETLQKAVRENHETDARVYLKQFDDVFPHVASPGLTPTQLEQKFAEAEQKQKPVVQPIVDPQKITEVATGGPLMPEDPEKEKEKTQEQDVLAKLEKDFGKQHIQDKFGHKNKELSGIRSQQKQTSTISRQVKPSGTHKAEVKWPIEKYDQIRKDPLDVKKIADNTGWPEKDVQDVKRHLFYDKHKLKNGTFECFDPDSEIASAWDRLTKGDFTHNDLDLLAHEYFELFVEREFGVDNLSAHNIAQKFWYWWAS